MPLFAGEEDVYRHIGRMLRELLDDPRLAPQFQRADTVVQYRYSDPEAVITVDMRRDTEPVVHLGETDLAPEVILTMDADTAHRFFLGEVNVTVGVARGEIRVEGPVGKVLKLVPLIRPSFARYRDQLESGGRADLVTA